MAEQGLSLGDIVEDISAILQTIDQQVTQQGAAMYDSLQKTLSDELGLHILSYIRFLEERELINYDRVSDELALTEAGQDALADSGSWKDAAAEAFAEHIYDEDAADPGADDDASEPTGSMDESDFPGENEFAEKNQFFKENQDFDDLDDLDQIAADLLDGPAGIDADDDEHAAESLFDGEDSEPFASSGSLAESSVSQAAGPGAHAQTTTATADQSYHPRDAMNGQGSQQKSAQTTELYQRISELGIGGVGTVYRATQTKLNRDVALKEVNQVFNVFAGVKRADIIGAFTDVVQRQASLVHPNIVQVLDIETEAEFPYVVTQYAPRGNLRRLIEMPDRPALTVALKYFMQILGGLSIAHDAGIVHGNIKPENVVLDAAGNAMLSDFGMANVVEREGANTAHVYVGVGTVAYMSPEQFQNPNSATVRSDVYSLGIMFYEMLTGKVPGRRSPMPSSFYPDIPRSLDDIFDKMSVDAIEDRYENVNQILEDLYTSEDCMALLDNRAGVLFMRDPIEFGELGGIEAGEAPVTSTIIAPLGAEYGGQGTASDDDLDAQLEYDALSQGLGEESSSDVEGLGEESSSDVDDDLEAGDVLGKLDKYGDMFKEEEG